MLVSLSGVGMDASYQFGIEEEFFLADATTRDTPGKAAKAFHRDVQARLPTPSAS